MSRDRADDDVVISESLAWEDRLHPLYPFADGYKKTGSKSGGANSPGAAGGVYQIVTGGGKTITVLNKQDTKEDKEGNPIARTEKVYLEQVGGTWLQGLYKKMGIPDDRYAHTQLITLQGKKDRTGNTTYLQSTFIEGYEDDLWKFAYRKQIENKYRERGTRGLARQLIYAHLKEKKALDTSQEKESKELSDKMTYLENERILGLARKAELATLQAYLPDSDAKNQAYRIRSDEVAKRIRDIEAEITELQNRQKELPASYLDKKNKAAVRYAERLKTVDTLPLTDELITYLANSELETMTRPSGVFNKNARRVVSDAILTTPGFKEDFVKFVAARLLVADFGVHNGNFGVAMTTDAQTGKQKWILTSLDFGAAFCGLPEEVNPYSLTKTGTKIYKNHLLEYDKEIIKGKEMADAFIQLGNLEENEIRQMRNVAMRDLEGLDKTGLFKAAKRMGIPYKELYDNSKNGELNEDVIIKQIREHMQTRMLSRANSLKKQGYALVLEHCLENNSGMLVVNQKKLQDALNLYPDLKTFSESEEFMKMPFVYHEDLSSSQQKKSKNSLVAEMQQASQHWTHAQPDHQHFGSTSTVKSLLTTRTLHHTEENHTRKRSMTASEQVKKTAVGLKRRFTEGAASHIMKIGISLGSFKKGKNKDKDKDKSSDVISPPTKHK